MIHKALYLIFAVAMLVPVTSVEASRKAATRPSPEVAAPESAEEVPAHRRGLLEMLFGRGAGKSVELAAGQDVEVDERMLNAVRLAERSARSRSIHRCWRFVKRALQEAGVVDCYPKTALAKQAAVELPERYGFKELDVKDPLDAPVGAVLVYGGRGAGHVELRTEKGFVSDHASLKPSPRPLIGVFVKPLEG